jgi:hypothetical protein
MELAQDPTTQTSSTNPTMRRLAYAAYIICACFAVRACTLLYYYIDNHAFGIPLNSPIVYAMYFILSEVHTVNSTHVSTHARVHNVWGLQIGLYLQQSRGVLLVCLLGYACVPLVADSPVLFASLCVSNTLLSSATATE